MLGWTPVLNSDTVVVGWSVKYDILDFFIVRGAGHVKY